jgi:hypothetical protein
LHINKSTLSVKKAAELTHNMYEITYALPDSKTINSQLLGMDDEQRELFYIVLNFFRVLQ